MREIASTAPIPFGGRPATGSAPARSDGSLCPGCTALARRPITVEACRAGLRRVAGVESEGERTSPARPPAAPRMSTAPDGVAPRPLTRTSRTAHTRTRGTYL